MKAAHINREVVAAVAEEEGQVNEEDERVYLCVLPTYDVVHRKAYESSVAHLLKYLQSGGVHACVCVMCVCVRLFVYMRGRGRGGMIGCQYGYGYVCGYGCVYQVCERKNGKRRGMKKRKRKRGGGRCQKGGICVCIR